MLELKYETKTEKNVEMKFSIQDIQWSHNLPLGILIFVNSCILSSDPLGETVIFPTF